MKQHRAWLTNHSSENDENTEPCSPDGPDGTAGEQSHLLSTVCITAAVNVAHLSVLVTGTQPVDWKRRTSQVNGPIWMRKQRTLFRNPLECLPVWQTDSVLLTLSLKLLFISVHMHWAMYVCLNSYGWTESLEKSVIKSCHYGWWKDLSGHLWILFYSLKIKR